MPFPCKIGKLKQLQMHYYIVYVVLTGQPTRLSIDQDSALTSQVIKELLTSLECTMKIISPWNHGSSKAERQIKTIGKHDK